MTEQQTNFKNKFENVGALWLGESKTGKKMAKLRINKDLVKGSNLVLFHNSMKRDKKHPDYNVFLDKTVDAK